MIHRLTQEKLDSVTQLALKLWPDNQYDDLKVEFNDILNDDNQCVFLFVADQIDVGFAHVSLRVDYVEGTDSSPVGFLEGIYVSPDYRNQGIARELIEACEQFAKDKGCTEFASDCELTNLDSILMHEKLGFEETNRIVCFKKKIERFKC
ncbi:GNAT family N-acetyltransferase [Macrococcoides canis]|uniref:aminoglycoside 6'-N-acetyltransferase n=2 Tax=Macrococcoides canis TaxID=1855823 RepID=UPI00207C3F09|nr:aminoglycoside 6'-N-acetyltransferase [Macrococcus canis]MCO4095386.1 GNAT family N-acetyltransferase [Macrococcus canis]UTH08113.1 GNAT family N-acetyltransferase [Macrococcus canis]